MQCYEMLRKSDTVFVASINNYYTEIKVHDLEWFLKFGRI